MEKLNNKTVLEIHKLKIKTNNKETVLNYGDFEIRSGDFIVVEGPNGSGKSTFLKLLTNEVGEYCTLIQGDILINKKSIFSYDLSWLRRNVITNISQDDSFLKNESIFQALIRPAKNALDDLDNKKVAEEKIKELAFEYYNKYIYYYLHGYNKNDKKPGDPKKDWLFMYFHPVEKLSGGQQKMIHILQGLIKIQTIETKILLLDEPLNNLDKNNKKIFINLLSDIRKKYPELIILLITHCKVFPGVNTMLKITEGETENTAELSRFEEELKPYDCLG